MRRAGDTGQATLELALCLPILMLMLASLVQVGILVGDQVRVWHAAREAARVAAVDAEETHIREAAEKGGLGPVAVSVTPGPSERVQGEPVTVDVGFSGSRRVPLVGPLIAPARLSAAVTMRIEEP